MSNINFIKMEALGNDFVIIPSFIHLTSDQVKLICDRRYGIGCDQLIILTGSKFADCKMLIFNSDGSEAGACGNATRAVAKLFKKKTGNIEIGGRSFAFNIKEESIEVNMGAPISVNLDPIALPEYNLSGYEISVGNPHFVVIVPDFDFDMIRNIGPKISTHSYFSNGANVNFAKVVSKNSIELKVWERGAGETLACGSGACATAYTLHKLGLCSNSATVKQQGGNLNILIQNDEILMQGDASLVFHGNIIL
jgi:diaminopimelate epimerase